jgi:flagellar hook-basal body protein
MSFYTSLTGLIAATTELAVTSNNIANAGTSGFKKSGAEFGDIFATSPLQKSSSVVGNGVSLKEMRQEFSQGNVEFSSNSLDLAITGDGFFALEAPDGTKVYTRNGGFMLNEQNQMVNSAGQALMSLPVDSTNKADFGVPLSALTIPRSTISEFKATTEVELGLNLPSDAAPITQAFNPQKPDTYHKTTSFTVYGASGSANLATIYYVKTENATADKPYNKWQTYVYIDDQLVQPDLIQATDSGGDSYFVNKYGEIKTLSELKELQKTSTESEKYLITTGTVYKKYSYDKLSKPIESTPATLELRITEGNPYYNDLNLTNGQSGVDFETLSRSDLSSMFKISIDGSGTIDVGLEHLAGYTEPMSGTEIAFELEKVLNNRFGDNKSFKLDANNGSFQVTRQLDDGSYISVGLDLLAAAQKLETQDGEISVIDESGYITTDNLNYMLKKLFAGEIEGFPATFKAYDEQGSVKNADPALTIADFSDIEMQYDAANLGFKFVQTTPDNVSPLYIANLDVDAADEADDTNPLFGVGLVTNPVIAADGSVETLANFGLLIPPLDTAEDVTLIRNIVPNGKIITPLRDNRYGISVTYADSTFSIKSGTTGDASSIKLVLLKDENGNLTAGSEIAKSLFGILEGEESNQVSAQLSAINNLPTVRGQQSMPAVIKGNTMGVDPRKPFSVNSSNRNLTVIVDGVSSRIQLTTGQYSIGTFTKHLEEKINLMADELGRQVSGVDVSFNEATESLVITGATTTSDSFIQIAGSQDWGLDNIDAAFGRTSSYITLQQDSQNNSPTYVYQSSDGTWVETTEKGGFDDNDIPYWTPIFLDKGELTFDTSGTIISPLSGIKMNSEAITGTSVSLDYSTSTQFNSPFAVLSQSQNGAPEGNLVGVNIGDDGLVVASYSNGTQKSLGKIIIANFKTAQGLRQIGDSNFMETSKSGVASYGEAGSAGFGTLRAGARERSNVDLTAELVDLITAQRNFQANAKAIETSSSMTQTIINIRG